MGKETRYVGKRNISASISEEEEEEEEEESVNSGALTECNNHLAYVLAGYTICSFHIEVSRQFPVSLEYVSNLCLHKEILCVKAYHIVCT